MVLREILISFIHGCTQFLHGAFMFFQKVYRPAYRFLFGVEATCTHVLLQKGFLLGREMYFHAASLEECDEGFKNRSRICGGKEQG